jgi:AAHS family 4-hydroxybenzoate transporter-like MFS transporter
VASLLKKPQRLQTMLLCSFSLFTFTTFYALCFWVPTVLTTLGFTVANAALGVAALGGGGVIGALLLIPLAARFGIRQILMVTSMATVALVGMTALRAFSLSELLIAIGAIGACLVAGTLGQVAIAVRMYEVQAQTTGVGYSAAWGRIGSIVGPAAGGLLISAGFEPQQLLFSAGVPASLAALIMALLLLTARKQVVQADALGQVD